MIRKIYFLFFLGGIVLLVLISNIVLSRPVQADSIGLTRIKECVRGCLMERDICLGANSRQESECTNKCHKQTGYGWDQNACLLSAENIFKICKSFAEKKAKDPWYVKILSGKGRTLEDCIDIFQKDQQNCRDKKTKLDSCLNDCKNKQQARYDKCMNDSTNCVDKCPSECKTNVDCDNKWGDSCAISACEEISFGNLNEIKKNFCSYKYKEHGTCCPGSTGPNTCKKIVFSETTCTGGPCGDRDSDGIPDGQDNCPDSPGVYTGECPKEPIQKKSAQSFPKKIYEKMRNMIISIFSKPKVSTPLSGTPAVTPNTNTRIDPCKELKEVRKEISNIIKNVVGGTSGSNTSLTPTQQLQLDNNQGLQELYQQEAQLEQKCDSSNAGKSKLSPEVSTPQKPKVIEKQPTPTELTKSPSFDTKYLKYITDDVTQLSVVVTPIDLAGKTITGLEVGLATRGYTLPAVTSGSVNLNESGWYQSDWKCDTTGDAFRCSGKDALREGVHSTVGLNFSASVDNPPPFLSIKLLGPGETIVVGIGVEFKPGE